MQNNCVIKPAIRYYPAGGLAIDAHGTVYGETSPVGASAVGTVFEVIFLGGALVAAYAASRGATISCSHFWKSVPRKEYANDICRSRTRPTGIVMAIESSRGFSGSTTNSPNSATRQSEYNLESLLRSSGDGSETSRAPAFGWKTISPQGLRSLRAARW